MIEILTFRNNTNKKIELFIEPLAESVDLHSGKIAYIKTTKISESYSDELAVVLEDDMLIYEARQCDMKIGIDGELKYYTSPYPKI